MTRTGVITEFPTPSSLAGRDSNPVDITVGPDQNLWYTDFYGRIGTVNPFTHAIREFQIGSPQFQVFFFGITSGPDGALWFVANCCGPTNGMIGRITTSGDVSFYPVAPGTGPAVGIASYAGQLWYGATNLPERNATFIQRMNTSGVVTANFPIPTPYADPSRLVEASDGNLYFTEQGAVGANGHQQPTHPEPGKIGRIDPSGNIAEFTVPNQVAFGDNPAGISAGLDGTLWFTEYSYLADDNFQQHGGNKIGRFFPATGTFVEYPIPTPYARADGIVAARDGYVYFTEDPNNFAYGAIGQLRGLP
jgi:virginiamycin B lyase